MAVAYAGVSVRTDGDSAERRASEAQELVTQLRRDFEERDKLYDHIDKVLFGDIPVNIPPAYDKLGQTVKSPLAGHIVGTITAALSVNAPVVQFQPVGFGVAATENATNRERFLTASWLRQEREAKRRLFRLFMYSLVAKGEGVLKTVERCKTAWQPYREYAASVRDETYRRHSLDHDAQDRVYNQKTEAYKRERAPYPIATTDVDPATFYYLKGLDGFTVTAEVKEVPYYDALVRYKQGLDSRGRVVPEAMGMPMSEWQNAMRGTTRTLKMVECYSCDDYVAYLLGPGQTSSQGNGRDLAKGTEVQRIRNHGYGDPTTGTLKGPYFQALGITTACRLPHRAGLGVLYGYLDLFPLMDTLLTVAQNNAILTGFASFKKNRPTAGQHIRPGPENEANPYGDEDDQQYEVIEPGFIYPDDIGPLEMPRAGVDFEKFITLVRGLLELALPSVVQGVVTGDESGYALNQATHLARLAWDPILDNAEFALSDRCGWESYLIETFVGERVYAWGEVSSKSDARRRAASLLSLGPKDLGGVHNYAVKLDPQTPSNRSLEVRLHREMVDAGFEAQADAIEALGGNVDEVNRQRLFEKFQQLPQVEERIFERTLQKLGWIDQQTMRQAREELALTDAASPSMPGQHLGPAGAVYAPGQGMPEVPTPPGGITGMPPGVGGPGAVAGPPPPPGPAGPGPGTPGGLPASLPGAPSNPAPPPTHMPLPGQA